MKERIAELLAESVDLSTLSREEILNLIEVPKDISMGDYAFPCFSLSKVLKKNPVEISKEIAAKLKDVLEFEKVEAVGPYLNFFLDKTLVAKHLIHQVHKQKDKFGSSNFGDGKKVLIEFSSPNIAKPFGIGHLRSTIIGNSISNISEFAGFNVIRMNYLGDWGTQFGKLIFGYEKFGDPAKLKKSPIEHLLEIYVKVNDNKDYEEKSREAFKKLEYGDEKYFALWKKFKALSLKDFEKVYKLLGVKFDVLSGESIYNTQMEEIASLLKQKNLLLDSEGAQIVDLNHFNLGVALIKKSDGTTLYATRDIAAALDRHKKYKFDAMYYEVGSEQILHFRQIFKVLELLGNSWAKNCVHIAHGLYLDADGKKFATRKGKTILMEDIISEATSLAEKEIAKREKTISKNELKKRSLAIALASIIYGDLKNYRLNDVVYDIARLTSFEGDTGPYLLYSYARSRSILRKAKYKPKKDFSVKNLSESEKRLISQLNNFPEIVVNAQKALAPNLIANYVYHLSQSFNEYYHSEKVIGSENEQFRLSLVDVFSQVLKNSLALLGISVIERM